MLRLPILPLLAGLLFFAASLTPSLIPRDWFVQGFLGGLVAALGYLIARFLLTLWRQMQLPLLRGRAARMLHVLCALPVAVVLVRCLAEAGNWQNDIRLRMGMAPVESAQIISMTALALAVFVALCLLGFGIRLAFDRTRGRLYRYMPKRTADVGGLVLVAVALFLVTRDGILDRVIAGLDQSYATAQELFDTAPPPPAQAELGGRPASAVMWDSLGRPGRNFLTGGPDGSDIAAFAGRSALTPLRIYVGLAQGDTPEERADRALAELIAAGGFQRRILVVAMPTGTGWLDPGSFDVLEYMHGGDVATVAAQYSYLQSPLALMLETEAGLAQAQALIHAVHDHWRSLPRDARPRLYMHGLSLGAWASMYGTDPFSLLDDPVNGALWVGPPFPSAFWNAITAARDPGSPFVAPRIGTGRLVRFADARDHGGGPEGWGSMRLMFLQYPSDPIVFYDPSSLWRAPAWMREPLAPDVSPALRFIPVVTQFQLALDMLLATRAPPGHGHSYVARDYIGPWRAVTAPEGWSDADSARLAAHCDNGFQQGCNTAARQAARIGAEPAAAD